MKSTILGFYSGNEKHIVSGLTIDQILKLDDNSFEKLKAINHLLFPLRKTSRQIGGPAITYDEIAQFKTNNELRKKYLEVFNHSVKFFGFDWTSDGDSLKLIQFPGIDKKKQAWLNPYSYHYSRISRILQSLMLLGFENIAKIFYYALIVVSDEHPKVVDQKTLTYWRLSITDEDYWTTTT